MEDPVLNRNLDEAKELQTRWSQFHDFIVMAMQQNQKITPQAEMKFLELKSRIAMLHDSFMSSLKHEQKIGQNIMAIVGDMILLNRLNMASEAERQKFEFDWNECFMLINEQVSAMDEEKKRLLGINERAFKANQQKELIKAKIYNFIHGTALKYGTIVAITVALLWIVPAYIWSYDNLYDIPPARPIYVKVVQLFYRPFLDPDKEYFNFSDVEGEPEPAPIAQIEKVGADALDLGYFKRALNSLGVSPNDMAEAQQLIDDKTEGRVTGGYSAERFAVNKGDDVQCFYLTFKSTANAKKFIDLCRAGLSSASPDTAKQIKDNAFVARRANFVAIGISKHPYREGRIKDRWKFNEKTANELTR